MIALTAKDVLPQDGTSGTLAGRVWLPGAAGPAVVAVRGDGVFDVTANFPTGVPAILRASANSVA